MASILSLLFLITLICFAVGFLKPSLFKFLFKEKTSRTIVGLVFGSVSMALLLILSAFIPKEDTQVPKTTAATHEPVQQAAKKTEVPVVPEKPKTEDEQIRELVTEVFKGTNTLKQERLRKVNIEKISGGWDVAINFNASEGFTNKLMKSGIEIEMSRAYKALLTANLNVKSVYINAYFPFQDKFGKSTDHIIYGTSLEKEVADKINWQANELTLENRIIPGVWRLEYLDSMFQ